jgi:selenocysteine-specific elongation factor
MDRDQLKRGDVLTRAGIVSSTVLFDAAYHHLPDVTTPLKHNMAVKLFVGATEVVARTRVLGAAQIEPGHDGWLQLALSAPVAIVRGDRFILRRPSPGTTLGGGRVLDPQPGRRHHRFRPEVTARLQTLAQGTPAELLLQTLTRLEPVTEAVLFKQAGLAKTTAIVALQELEAKNQLTRLDQQLLSRAGWQRWLDRLTAILTDYHREFPLRSGMSREELRSRLKIAPAVFNPLLNQAASAGTVVEAGALVHKPGHQVTFTPDQQAAIDALLRRFSAAGSNSPSVKESKSAVGEDVYAALVELGQLQPINSEVVYAASDYEQLIGQIKHYLQANGHVNAAQARDLLNTSRKYAIALLEHLDELRVTRRVGDDRLLI